MRYLKKIIHCSNSIVEVKQCPIKELIKTHIKKLGARKCYRKWDNVKHLSAFGKLTKVPKKSFAGELCGVKLCVKERLSSVHSTISFGIVVTIKEMKGVNRIEVINKAEKEVVFE